MHCHTASHATGACSPLQAYAPQYPVPKEERWYFLLADPSVVRGSLLMKWAMRAMHIRLAVLLCSCPKQRNNGVAC